MNDKINPIATQIKAVKQWPYALAYQIATSLYAPEKRQTEGWSITGLGHQNFSSAYYPSILVQGGLLSSYETATIGVSITALAPDIYRATEDFYIKPRYTREFRIRVTSFRIDRNSPKIFAD